MDFERSNCFISIFYSTFHAARQSQSNLSGVVLFMHPVYSPFCRVCHRVQTILWPITMTSVSFRWFLFYFYVQFWQRQAKKKPRNSHDCDFFCAILLLLCSFYIKDTLQMILEHKESSVQITAKNERSKRSTRINQNSHFANVIERAGPYCVTPTKPRTGTWHDWAYWKYQYWWWWCSRKKKYFYQ